MPVIYIRKYVAQNCKNFGEMKVLWCSVQEAKGKQYIAAIMEDPNADMIGKRMIRSTSHFRIIKISLNAARVSLIYHTINSFSRQPNLFVTMRNPSSLKLNPAYVA